MRPENSISLNIKFFFRAVFLNIFQAWQVLFWRFLNLRLKSSIFGNIRNLLILELGSSISWNMKKILILGLESLIFSNITNFFGVDFFYFFKFGLKIAPGGPITHYSLPTVLKFWQYFFQTLIGLLEYLFCFCCIDFWKMLWMPTLFLTIRRFRHRW